jgi:two-component system, OmpR family, sensor histidine kinase VicK
MFDSSLAVPLHFTVEFVGFLVAAGGAFLVLSRPALVPGEPGRRRLVAAGFAALAIAHVLHGGAFMAADGEDVLTLIRAMGFAVMLVGLAGRTMPTASVGATFQVKDPLALVPGALALLASAAALFGSFRGGPKTNLRLAAGLFLFAISEVFVAVAPTFEFGVGEAEPAAFISHGSKLLAYIAIGSWLWSGVRSSIRTRFVASFVTLLVFVVLALATSLTQVISDQVEDEELKRVGIQLGTAIEGLSEDSRQLNDAIALAFESESLPRTIMKKDPTSVARTILTGLEDLYTIDFVVVNPEVGGIGGAGRGTSGSFITQVASSGVVRELAAARSGQQSVEIEPVGGRLTILAAGEVAHPTNPQAAAGTVILGRHIDARWIEGVTNAFEPAKASLVVNGRTVATDLPGKVPARALVGPEAEAQLRALAEDQRLQVKRTFGSRSYFTALAPIEQGRAGRQVGVLALSSPARIVADTRSDVTKVLFLVAMAAAAIALALAWYSGRRITRPIQQLTATAREVRGGNLAAQAPVGGADEVGQLGETFNEMTLSMLRLTEDLRLAAREEQQLRGRIETIIESMADGLIAVDANRDVLAFNREAQQLTGLSPDEAIGRPVSEVLSVTNAKGDPVTLPIYELGQGSTPGVLLRRGGDDSVPVSVTSAVLRDDAGETAGAVAVLRNMTREREIERMKSEFLSNISHELRTPLTPIKGYAEILTRKEVPPDKIKRFTQGILDSTSRLERIVELLVDFSAMEAGRLAPKSTPVNIGELVRALAEATETRTPRHDVVMDIKSRLPKIVGDERLLRRSLEEILDNAVKFSPQGGTIKVEVKGVATGNGQGKRRGVAVSISDEGIGIEPENLQRIFSDFHQLDGSETRAYGGLGLGLAFVQRIVEAHDGQVDVESQPEQGTRFTVTLPGAGAISRE